MLVDQQILETPGFYYICGHTSSGKTFFCNELVRQAIKKKYKIIYIIRADFPLEKDIDEIENKNKKNVCVIPTLELNDNLFQDLQIEMANSKEKKIVLIDNFTYAMNKNLLNLTTFFRKYNASLFFLCHTLQPHKDLAARLKESFSYLIMFWIPGPMEIKGQKEKPQRNSTQSFLGDSLYKLFLNEVKPDSYKFLLINFKKATYTVSKLPEFKIEFKNNEQTQTIREEKNEKKQNRLKYYDNKM